MNETRLTFKLIFFAILLFSGSLFAGTCNKASLKGNYNFVAIGATAGDIEHLVGRIYFNAAGSASASAIDTKSGGAASMSGSGTYTVSSGCVASGTIGWSTGLKSTYWLYLDQMDWAPATALAYHGSFAVRNNNGTSASGEVNRVIGKF